MTAFSDLFRRQLVGLDLGMSGIKAVELTSKKNPRLLAYNRIPLPLGTIGNDGEIKDRELVIAALRKLFSHRQFTTKRVAVGATGNSVMTKKITVPKMNRVELAQQLYWEAEQYLPFNISEVNLDFAILGTNTQSQAGSPMIDVMLVAAKKDYIQSLSLLIEEAGLVAEVIDNQSFALGNAFEFNYSHLIGGQDSSLSVIVDFGAGSTKVTIVEGDKTTFSRELRQCGLTCTTMLSERLAISYEQAEKIKITEASAAPIKAVISEFVYSVAEEILRTLDFYISQSSERSIQAIYVCGGASKTEGLMQVLEAKLPAPVQPLNPIQNIAGSGRQMNAQAIRELSYLGSVAIGLSLRTSGDAG